MPERDTEVAAHGVTITPSGIELIPGQRSGFIETPWIDTAMPDRDTERRDRERSEICAPCA